MALGQGRPPIPTLHPRGPTRQGQQPQPQDFRTAALGHRSLAQDRWWPPQPQLSLPGHGAPGLHPGDKSRGCQEKRSKAGHSRKSLPGQTPPPNAEAHWRVIPFLVMDADPPQTPQTRL